MGDFLSVDPILDPGVPAQFNAYSYSANNPTTYSDPSGMIPETGGNSSTSWDALGKCRDIWCAWGWGLSNSAQTLGGIGEGLMGLVQASCAIAR